jgi:DNA-binding GntR family transcriptional regulator
MNAAPTPTLKIDVSQPIGLQLYQHLRGRIIRGEFPPGARLSEAGVAGELQISRQPVRETFIKLAEEGLLEVRPQRGTMVPKISARMVEEARFIREAIEADVIKLAASTFGHKELALLDALLAEQKRATSIPTFVELDDRFHRTLAEGVGRAHAWNVVEALKAQLDRVRYLSLQQFPKDALIEQHSAVIEAVRSGDVAAAEQAMRLHLRMITNDLPMIAAEHSDYFED